MIIAVSVVFMFALMTSGLNEVRLGGGRDPQKLTALFVLTFDAEGLAWMELLARHM